MSRLETILEAAKAQLTGDTDMDLAIIRLAAAEVDTLNDAEMAEIHAYKQCTACGRLYTLAQWVRLMPACGGLWKLDAETLEEYRNCSYCHSTLVVHERFGVRVEPSHHPSFRVAKLAVLCQGCGLPIEKGEIFVLRVDEDERPAPGKREFCSAECEAGG